LVILDSEHKLAPQARWLEEDLKRAREDPRITFIIAFIHNGPFGTSKWPPNKRAERLIVPILRKYGPSIVISGHAHNYERGEVDGLPFYVTGGGGAVLHRRGCSHNCPAWSHIFLPVYHYLTIEASPSQMTICPYYPSGKLVEPCITRQSPVRATSPVPVLPAAPIPAPEPDLDIDEAEEDIANQPDDADEGDPVEAEAEGEPESDEAPPAIPPLPRFQGDEAWPGSLAPPRESSDP
jgi:hypothetical protein